MKGGNQTMKQIINGLTYNTDTAEHLGHWDNGYTPGDFYYCDEDLMRTKKGRYFIWGYGGAASKYCSYCDDGWTGSGERLVPVSAVEAKMWAEEHLTTEEYVAAFGEPEEA